MAGSQERITTQNPDQTGSASQPAAPQRQPGAFLNQLLAAQCRQAKADSAVILRPGPAGRPEILAAHPFPGYNGTAYHWVSKAEKPFRKVMESGRTVVVRQGRPSDGESRVQRYLMVIPIGTPEQVRAAAAFRIKTASRGQLALCQARLEPTALLLDRHELELTANGHMAATNRLRKVLEVLDAANGPTRFLEAAMVLCNELATWLGCSRVSFGFLQGRYVHVKAISHTDTFSRRMQVVQSIETVMEECLDQDLEVLHPAADTAMVASRCAAEHAESHGPAAVLSVPVRRAGEPAAVVTLERPLEKPFDQMEEIEAVRLVCDLCAPRLIDLAKQDRWLGARLMEALRRQAGRLIGHEHTGLKLIALTTFIAGLLLATMNGEYRIDTPFTLKAQHRQVVAAPFATFSKTVLVEPGDRVESGQTVLGTLDTVELRLQLAALMAEQLGYRKQMTAAMRDHKTAEAHIAEAQIQEVEARIRLIQSRIDQARLVAPIDGWVVSEDRKQSIGAPVETGEILFEIAGIDSLRAELYVPETAVTDLAVGQEGLLAAVGHPDQKIGFVIERINPIAEVIDNRNVFKVRTRILEQPEWMRPGMEGEAKISAGRKTYLWLATHRLVDWVRMKLWI